MAGQWVFVLGFGIAWLGNADRAEAQAFRVGDTVECSGMRGTIIRTEPRPGWDEPFYVVRVEGAATVYENKCLPRMMRSVGGGGSPASEGGKPIEAPVLAPPTASAEPGFGGDREGGDSLCQRGARLEGQWGIQWYEVTVRAPPNERGECPVRFDGYGSSWDNFIGPGQLRPRGSGPVTRPARRIADTPIRNEGAQGAPPDGTYRCHKISPGGQLMDVGTLTVRNGRSSLAGMPAGWTVRSVFVRGTNDRGELVVAFDYRSAAEFNDRLDCLRR